MEQKFKNISDNQKALAKEINLKLISDPRGNAVLVEPKSGVVPESDVIVDTYYPNLYKRVINQKVTDSIRGFALENVFSKEMWENGLKDEFYNGILQLLDYNKNAVIDDWNPADPNQYQNKYDIDFRKYSVIKTDRLRIISAFTNGATLENFVNQQIKQLMETINYFIQNEKAKILADEGGVINLNPDRVVDFSALDLETQAGIQDAMNAILDEISTVKTASPNHLALTDDTVIYSAQPNNLVLVYDSKFWNQVRKANSTLFNPEQLANGLSSQEVDFSVIPGITKNIHAILMDKESLVHGVQIENSSWDFKAPKAQVVQELHNWFGFMRRPNMRIVKFESLTGVKSKKLLTKINKLKNLDKKEVLAVPSYKKIAKGE